jgi:hypothetical protein
MKDTLNDILSVHWWISVAIASLVLNVAASYLRDGLNRALPRLSSRFRSFAHLKTEEFTNDIDRASGDVSLMTYLAARQAGYHIVALHHWALMCLFFYIGGKVKSLPFMSTALFCIGALFSVVAACNFGRAMRCKVVLDAVQRRQQKPKSALTDGGIPSQSNVGRAQPGAPER